MDLRSLILEYLQAPRVMQLATSVNNKPWVCNIHFYVDSDFNFYWISTETRRHSQEIAKNSHAAITIQIHEDTPEEDYVIGISAEGEARLLLEEEVRKVGLEYARKLEKSSQLIEDILSGKNSHKFYKLTPKKIVLFDSKNFPEDPRREYIIQ